MKDSSINSKSRLANFVANSAAHARPPHVRFAQNMVRWFFRIFLLLCYRIRIHGLENYPCADGALICPNHQSNLDPIVMGVSCPRPVNYLAKETLFRWKPLGWFLSSNDAIPIDREGAGIAGMKETLRRLKRGESVVIFPEGSRSLDGELQPLMKGFCSLARRTSASLVPAGIEGTYDAMPPKCRLPRCGQIQIVFGPPVSPDEYADLDDDAMVELLRQRIEHCFAQARKKFRN